jgi:hypothetical protein
MKLRPPLRVCALLLMLLALESCGGDSGVTTPTPPAVPPPPPSPPPPNGSLVGTVSDTSGGVLSGVAVQASTSSGTVVANGRTNNLGQYSFASLPVGQTNIVLSNVPERCALPTYKSVTIVVNYQSTIDFNADCRPIAGTVTGTLVSSIAGAIDATVPVTATPQGKPASAVTANANFSDGTFSLSNVRALPLTVTTGLARNTFGYCLPTSNTYPGPQSDGATINLGAIPVTCTGQLWINFTTSMSLPAEYLVLAIVTESDGTQDTLHTYVPGAIAFDLLKEDAGTIKIFDNHTCQRSTTPVAYSGITAQLKTTVNIDVEYASC